MTDQNQPKLSLEEELDVLEAVYKVGKEKGLELLRPEQMKKLRDAGRVDVELESGEETASRARSEEDLGRLGTRFSRGQAGILIFGLKAKLGFELEKIMGGIEEWGRFTKLQREFALSCYFAHVYGVSELELLENLEGGGNNGN